ncbi:MAG: biotin synthase BioB [Endomicrobiaceae bacterium]|nr:biotin synthase BioB [Endomicrobiaceae bacterium]
MIEDLKLKVLNGYQINKAEALNLVHEDLIKLTLYANEIRNKFCGHTCDVCSIINGKSGKCSEDCKYCAQSSYYKTTIQEYQLLSANKIVAEALHNHSKGILRFSIVTSGRKLTDDELSQVCDSYRKIKEKCDIYLCASHGLLSYEQLVKLKQAGVSRYHCNIETSRKNFHNICTTHTYDDKINTIKNAKKAGLEVCSGFIIGMGETIEDRIDMLLDLRDLNIKSVPINILTPIKATPYENILVLKEEEICRSIAISRFILPKAMIRLAGGRGLFKDKGKSMLNSGANAAISGDMLTTTGISIDEDMKMISQLGFKVRKI